MKDESKGIINVEFVGLKSKMQSIKNVKGKGNKRGKGVNKNVIKNTKHEEYLIRINFGAEKIWRNWRKMAKIARLNLHQI